MSSSNMFTAIRAMLIDCMDDSVYPANTIKYAYQAPLQSNFIAYWCVNQHKTGLLGVNSYDYIQEKRNNVLLFENLIQVDFYSDANSPFISSDSSDIFNQYLTSYAPEFLRYNYPDITIGVVHNGLNLTEPGDKAAYLNRYTNRFTLFTHNVVIRPEIFFDEINILPTLID